MRRRAGSANAACRAARVWMDVRSVFIESMVTEGCRTVKLMEHGRPSAAVAGSTSHCRSPRDRTAGHRRDRVRQGAKAIAGYRDVRLN